MNASVIAANVQEGRAGRIATHYTFDVIDDDGDGQPEFAVLSGNKSGARFAGHLTLYRIDDAGAFSPIKSSAVKF